MINETKNFEAVASVLTATSVKGYTYKVKDCYKGFSSRLVWTTIIQCDEYGDDRCQILDPGQHEMIELASTTEALFEAVMDIKNDKYFTDK